MDQMKFMGPYYEHFVSICVDVVVKQIGKIVCVEDTKHFFRCLRIDKSESKKIITR